MVSGRSIGSGPACHLSAIFNPLCLILISPIKSVHHIAQKIFGRLLSNMLLEERFNNIEKVKDVKCPTIILHGMKDDLVDYEDSIEMIMKCFFKSEAHLFLLDKMTHNVFDYDTDLIKPLKYFFNFH